MSTRDFDVIVIGAGPAGEVCAGRLAENGLDVALVERELVGGECSFYACMPSKALLRPAQALAEARRVPGAAEGAGGELDVAAVLRRRDEIVHDLHDDAQLPWIEKRGIALVRGHGTVVDERTVRVVAGQAGVGSGSLASAGTGVGSGSLASAGAAAGSGLPAGSGAGAGSGSPAGAGSRSLAGAGTGAESGSPAGAGTGAEPGSQPGASEQVLHARRAVVLAPGTTAAIPPIPGLRECNPWTNREVTTAKAIPGSLLVLGGGVVGVEMAAAYASLGARVTIVEALPRLIAGEEEFASEQVREALVAAGVEVILGVKATAARRSPPERAGAPGRRDPGSEPRDEDAGAEPDSDARVASKSKEEFPSEVTLELENGLSVTGEELLVAVGRRPHTDDLGLEVLGLEPGRSVEVDEEMRVPGHRWLYVVGDANGRALLTHMGKYQARLAADRILERPTELRSDGRLAPRVIFTEPQVAAVGHTLRSAEDAGLNARAVDTPTEGSAGGSFVGHGAPGTARIVVDEDRRVIVGATFTGVDVAESLHAATIAVVGEVPLERLWHAVPCFPTRSELWLNLLEGYGL